MSDTTLIPLPENSEIRPEHLSSLKTSWTQIHAAHIPGPEGQMAMQELISRYHDAVERYLRIKIKDQNLADDLTAEIDLSDPAQVSGLIQDDDDLGITPLSSLTGSTEVQPMIITPRSNSRVVRIISKQSNV